MGQTSKCALIIADGREEAVLPGRFDSKDSSSTMIEYVLDSVWTVVDEILVIFNREPELALIESIAPFGVKVAVDREGSGTLSKIVVGLKACNSEDCLVVPVSNPFIKPNVIYQLFQEVKTSDAAIPRWSDGALELLLAVYKKKPFLKAAAGREQDDLQRLVEDLYAVTFVQIEENLKSLDPDLLSFFKVKNDADFSKARSIASSQEGH
jgi:molybdopterin-guanine dinucleotide biosynthesis protein A